MNDKNDVTDGGDRRTTGPVPRFDHEPGPVEALRAQRRQLGVLLRLCSAIFEDTSEKPLDAVLGVVCEELESDLGSIDFEGYRQDAPLRLTRMGQTTSPGVAVPGEAPPDTWARQAAQLRRTVIAEGDCGGVPGGCAAVERVVSVPLIVGGKVAGTLTVANRNDPYHRAHVDLLESVARFIAPVLEALARRQTRVQARIDERKAWAEARIARGTANALQSVLDDIVKGIDQACTRLEPEHTAVGHLRDAQVRARHGLSVVDKLGTFGQLGLAAPEPFDLNAVVSEVLEEFRSSLGQGVDVSFEPSDELAFVMGDRDGLRRVVTELMSNAVDALYWERSIRVSTAPVRFEERDDARPVGLPPGPYARLTVRDSGVGMEASVQNLVFEPYFTTKDRCRGAGLGLSAARSIVQYSGGEITAVGEAHGGSSLHVFLPFASQSASPLPVRAPDSLEPPMTIMVVDDEPIAARFVSEVLSRAGYAVIQACSGEEALAIIAERGQPIDLLVTDIMMEPINGPELVARLTATQPDLPVVYVSGFPGDWLSLQGSLSAEETFLEKPFDSRTLRQVVRALLTARREPEP
jgi:signal transduction histidine kinase/CheY-like chemotaxis protein